MIVPPSALSEFEPLLCRSLRKPVRNDCKAAVPDVLAGSVAAAAFGAAFGLAAVLALPVEIAVDVLAALAAVCPLSAEIKFVNAVFKVDSVLAESPEPELEPSSSLLARSFTRVCNAAVIPCWV